MKVRMGEGFVKVRMGEGFVVRMVRVCEGEDG